jgi:hypothetical protein
MAPRRICAGEATVSYKSMMAVRGSIGFANLPLMKKSCNDWGQAGAMNIVSLLHLHKGLSRANDTMLAAMPPCVA